LEFGYGGGVLEGKRRETDKQEEREGKWTLLWMLAWSADGGMQKYSILKTKDTKDRRE